MYGLVLQHQSIVSSILFKNRYHSFPGKAALKSLEMKSLSYLSVTGMLAMLLFCSCTKADALLNIIDTTQGKPSQTTNLCVDIDGNTYKTVKIGNMVWMAENLRVTRFRDGQSIPNITDANAWGQLGNASNKSAWVYYNNDAKYNQPYGKLYNWYAVMDPRGLAPKGWHIPTNEEWIALGAALGGAKQAGGRMKTIGTIEAGNGLWKSPNKNATNSSGFSAVPTGERGPDGVFDGMGLRARWWTTNNWEGDPFNLYSLNTTIYGSQAILFNSTGENVDSYNVLAGLAVRCVKD
jgi:uncharacterized protein (TIGR02145 family)